MASGGEGEQWGSQLPPLLVVTRCLWVVAELVSSIRAGLPPWITPYTLRHTCASLLARQGVHPTVAADVLGHDPAVYLRTYAHLYPEDRARAAAALDAARLTGSPRS